MKNLALFSLKDKSKKLKCCLLQFLFSALRVNTSIVYPNESAENELPHLGLYCLPFGF